MKKIMIFIGGYLPGQKYGGPVTSINNFVSLLGNQYQIKIVCSNHDFGEKEKYKNISQGWNQVGKAKVLYLPDNKMKYGIFKKILEKEQPNLIYGSGIMYIKVNFQIIQAAKKLKIPFLLAPRGDLCENALRIKKWKKIPFLKVARISGIFNSIYFHSTMEEESRNLQKYLGINPNRIWLLPNLPASYEKRTNYVKETGKLKILFISRIQEKKNLLTAIKIVNKLNGEIQFDIYGPIENEEYWNKCKNEIKKRPNNVEINYNGPLGPNEAKSIYNRYDCLLFPTFSENYGHVIAESLLHGCPPVISYGTTPWDNINEYQAGRAIPLNNVERFCDELNQLAAMENREYEKIGHNIEKYIQEQINVQELVDDYNKMIQKISD